MMVLSPAPQHQSQHSSQPSSSDIDRSQARIVAAAVPVVVEEEDEEGYVSSASSSSTSIDNDKNMRPKITAKSADTVESKVSDAKKNDIDSDTPNDEESIKARLQVLEAHVALLEKTIHHLIVSSKNQKRANGAMSTETFGKVKLEEFENEFFLTPQLQYRDADTPQSQSHTPPSTPSVCQPRAQLQSHCNISNEQLTYSPTPVAEPKRTVDIHLSFPAPPSLPLPPLVCDNDSPSLSPMPVVPTSLEYRSYTPDYEEELRNLRRRRSLSCTSEYEAALSTAASVNGPTNQYSRYDGGFVSACASVATLNIDEEDEDADYVEGAVLELPLQNVTVEMAVDEDKIEGCVKESKDSTSEGSFGRTHGGGTFKDTRTAPVFSVLVDEERTNDYIDVDVISAPFTSQAALSDGTSRGLPVGLPPRPPSSKDVSHTATDSGRQTIYPLVSNVNPLASLTREISVLSHESDSPLVPPKAKLADTGANSISEVDRAASFLSHSHSNDGSNCQDPYDDSGTKHPPTYAPGSNTPISKQILAAPPLSTITASTHENKTPTIKSTEPLPTPTVSIPPITNIINNSLSTNNPKEEIQPKPGMISVLQSLNIDSRQQDGSASEDVDANMEEFLKVPSKLEGLLFFGLAICVDSFLNVLTLLPLRLVWSLICLFCTILRPAKGIRGCRFHRRHMYQMIRASVIYLVYRYGLCPISIGKLYHWIRGQAMIKIYVVIGMADVFDRLMCSLGQDALDSLYWNTTRRPYHPRLFVSALVVLVYALLHSLVLLVHIATLDVAMNSSDHALFSLLISGNFTEIKSSVFKKYNKQNLFKIATADICERFKLVLFLSLVLLLNCFQGGMDQNMVKNYLGMCGIIMLSEMLCDWIKHSFITKFNFIKSSAYPDYSLILAGDVTGIGHEGVHLDHTHAVVKRLGLAQIPLVCVMARYLREAARYIVIFSSDGDTSSVMYSFMIMYAKGSWSVLSAILLGMFVLLLMFKILLGYWISRVAHRMVYGPPEGENAKHNDKGLPPSPIKSNGSSRDDVALQRRQAV